MDMAALSLSQSTPCSVLNLPSKGLAYAFPDSCPYTGYVVATNSIGRSNYKYIIVILNNIVMEYINTASAAAAGGSGLEKKPQLNKM